jgi:hypothetical protein
VISVAEILGSDTKWVDRQGNQAPIGVEDILIIAPYNAQVFELQARVPDTRIGTVDKFQGQEAPIAIYSITTSSYADAPRGMEFLCSPIGSTWQFLVQRPFAFWSVRLRYLKQSVERHAIYNLLTPFADTLRWQPQLSSSFGLK